MKYSIIVPVHNAESTITRCVESVVSQNVDLQVILIENGSSDRSANECEILSQKYNCVEYYQSKLSGVSYARNIGLDKAEGDIIGFCDADDYYEPDCLEKVSNIFEQYEIDIVYMALYIVNNGTHTLRSVKRERIINSFEAIDNVVCNGLDRARDNHSLNSADYIDRQFKDSRSVLSQNSDLSANEIKALKAIIIAHSNLKDRSVQESDNGLKSHKLQDYKARLGIIRTRFLAGVLRLADELDVSVERLGTGELQQELEEQEQKYNIIKNKQNCSEIEEKQMEEWKGFEKSLEFWHKLHLISSVERKEDDDKQIVLVVDDDYVQQKLDESQTETSIARQLVEIYSKINKELKEAVEISFTGKKLVNYVPIREIVITTEIESLNKEIDKSLNVRSLEPVSLEDKEDKKKLIL